MTAAALAWDARHAVRLQRFELVSMAALVAILSAAVVGLAGVLDATRYGVACDPLAIDTPPACAAMGEAFHGIQAVWEPPLRGLLIAVPMVAAGVLGVPLVARELERGTARLAWSLVPSRARWFVSRLLPVLAAVAVAGLVAGIALDRLAGGLEPWTDPARSFDGFGSRGIVFAARVVFVFAIAVAAGALIGRSLPALIVAAVIAVVAIAGGTLVHGKWLATEAVAIDDPAGNGIRGSLFVEQLLRDPSGSLLTWDEAYAQAPPDMEEWPPAGWTFVSIVVPPEHAPFASAREVVALSLASIAFLGLAGSSVTRRRPG